MPDESRQRPQDGGPAMLPPTIDLSPESVEAIAQRVAALVLAASATVAPRIEPDAIYTAPQAARLVSMHLKTVQEKLRLGIIKGRNRGQWRIRGADLLKLTGSAT